MAPQVLVEQGRQSARASSDGWLVAWRIENLGQHPLRIDDVRLPHSRFRSPERKLAPAPQLSAGESFQLELSVKCGEPPGTVVENAFLIFRVLWREEAWRVFARLRVTFGDRGDPKTVTELVTVQPVGFSGIED